MSLRISKYVLLLRTIVRVFFQTAIYYSTTADYHEALDVTCATESLVLAVGSFYLTTVLESFLAQ